MHDISKSILFSVLGAGFGIGVFVTVILLSGGSIMGGPVPAFIPPSASLQNGLPPQPAAGANNRSAEGPWTRDLRMRWSDDATVFGEATTFVERAGVPSVIQAADGQLIAVFQWFPEDDAVAFDKIAVAFSEDEGATWTDPELIVVEGMPATHQRPFDPTVVQMEDGKFRLYFTSHELGSEDLAIFSAVSNDAVVYALEEGERMNVEGKRNYDAAALRAGDTWHLMTPGPGGPGSAYYASATDGVAFGEPVLIGEEGGIYNWTGNLLADGTGMRFYGSSAEGLWWAYSEDGATWTEPILIEGDGGVGGDPTVVQVGDRFLMVYVSSKVR